MIKKMLLWTGLSLFAVILLSFFAYRRINLFTFINSSFYVSGALLIISFLTLVIQKGFFDGIFYGFRSLTQLRDNSEGNEEITPLSELISFKYSTMLGTGLIMLFLMLIALIGYYL
ncbi:DUF3899 domain-containing protein [Peribacillus sp. SCS-155]|uniref:DUF3899 domain-containing protein n=1 Tax=Peribacillus sedimenti TaxID=3115297 RepID=UPI0039061666